MIKRCGPVVLAVHLVSQQLQLRRHFVLVARLNERHLATAAEQEPRRLSTDRPLTSHFQLLALLF